MRLVTTPNFCRVCVEALWHALLRRVSLIDGLVPSCSPSGARTLDLALVPLAQFRDRENLVGVREGYEVKWTKDGVEVPEWKNMTKVVDDGEAVGVYEARVRYWTEEVRVDRDRSTLR